MPTQSYRLTLSRTAPDLSVLSFTAAESVNDTYRLTIDLTSTDSTLPLSSYIGQPATFEAVPSAATHSD